MMDSADCRYVANQCHALAGKAEIDEGRRKVLLETGEPGTALPRNLFRLSGAASPRMRRLEDVTW
jgi:hypothetical protein